MQAVCAVLPELEHLGEQPIAAPGWGERDRVARVPRVELGYPGLEAIARSDLLALLGGRRREAAGPWPGRPVRGRLGLVHGTDRTGNPNLTPHGGPVKRCGRSRVSRKIPPLAAVPARVEAEAIGVDSAEEHHPHRWSAIGRCGGERERGGERLPRPIRLGQPGLELTEGIRVEVGRVDWHQAGTAELALTIGDDIGRYRRPVQTKPVDGSPNVVRRPGAVLLDLDGTLVDTVGRRIEAWLAAFEEAHIPADRTVVAPLIGSDGRWLARHVAELVGVALDDERTEAIDRRAGELFQALNLDPTPLPGARDLLLALDASATPWAIATSSRREQVRSSIEALRLPREPVVVDGTHVSHAKPEPDLLLLAAGRLAVAPRRTWCIGDSTFDMLAAVAARMRPIGVTTGSVDAATLTAAGAAEVVESLAELVARLTRTA